MNADQLRRDIADLEAAWDTLARFGLMEIAEPLTIEIRRITAWLADEECRLLSALKEKGATE
jgi:hypothetical protein